MLTLVKALSNAFTFNVDHRMKTDWVGLQHLVLSILG